MGPRVARWYICNADSDRNTPIHWTSADSSTAPGGNDNRLAARTPSTRVVMSARSM